MPSGTWSQANVCPKQHWVREVAMGTARCCVIQEVQDIPHETFRPTGKHRLAGPGLGSSLLSHVQSQNQNSKRPGEPKVKWVSWRQVLRASDCLRPWNPVLLPPHPAMFVEECAINTVKATPTVKNEYKHTPFILGKQAFRASANYGWQQPPYLHGMG